MTFSSQEHMLAILRDTIVASVRGDVPDLSARQLAVFLICYLQDTAQTVRSLAQELNVSKPAITRALDRLGELDLARRKIDPLDKRSVFVQRTMRGNLYLNDLRNFMKHAEKSPEMLLQECGQEFTTRPNIAQFRPRQAG